MHPISIYVIDDNAKKAIIKFMYLEGMLQKMFTHIIRKAILVLN